MGTKRSWKRLKRAGVALALGVTGCGLPAPGQPQAEKPAVQPVTQPAPLQPAGDFASVDASIQDSLNRLNALQLFSVEGLVLDLPQQARECYNLPCPGDTASWDAYRAERARQAPRLARLATQAEQCNDGNCTLETPCYAWLTPDQAVQALNALQIISVGSILSVQPANNPACYNLPCASDKEAADIENNRRAEAAYSTATNAQRSKL
jgi:hypothetical protein